MKHLSLAVISTRDIALFGVFLFLISFVLFILFLFNIWKSRQTTSLSPYSHQPLVPANAISWYPLERTLRFLYEMHEYDNRIFELKKAAICRETGRIFQEARTWYHTIYVDWNFIQKRYPGNYVSWGSLTPEQQAIVYSLHDTLEGFQTEFSSPKPQPRSVEAKYALAKPGPLYVDVNTYILLGWKIVPGTELEVLIVQKPTIIIMPTV